METTIELPEHLVPAPPAASEELEDLEPFFAALEVVRAWGNAQTLSVR